MRVKVVEVKSLEEYEIALKKWFPKLFSGELDRLVFKPI